MKIASLSPSITDILSQIGMGSSIVCEEIESIESTAPDIVFTFEALGDEIENMLHSHGSDIITLPHGTLTDLYGSIHSMGMILQREEEASRLEESIRQGMNAVKKRARNLPYRPRIFISQKSDALISCGLWIPELIRLAGGESYPGNADQAISSDELSAWDPEMIVFCSDVSVTPSDQSIIRAQYEGKDVRFMDAELLLRPGPKLVEGTQRIYGWMFELLH